MASGRKDDDVDNRILVYPPTVQGTLVQSPRRGTFAQVRCPYCERIHVHTPYPGHRVSHCLSPGSSAGYVIELDPEVAA